VSACSCYFSVKFKSCSDDCLQPREKQVEIDQLQYELGAVRRRTDTEVASLRQRVADLELQVCEARKEADEYYRASVERNTEATALAHQVSLYSLLRGDLR